MAEITLDCIGAQLPRILDELATAKTELADSRRETANRHADLVHLDMFESRALRPPTVSHDPEKGFRSVGGRGADARVPVFSFLGERADVGQEVLPLLAIER